MTQAGTKREFDFTKNNLEMVQKLLASGLSYKQVAKRLNKDYCTKVKHKSLSSQTIANILQAYKNGKIEAKAYSDSDAVHNPPVNKKTPKRNVVDTIEAVEPVFPGDNNETEIAEIMACNLSDSLKIKALKWILG